MVKERQAEFLKSFAKKFGLWLSTLPAGSVYLTRGVESEVYLAENKLNIIKVNNVPIKHISQVNS